MVLSLCSGSSIILLLIFKGMSLESMGTFFITHSCSSGSQKPWCQGCYLGYLTKYTYNFKIQRLVFLFSHYSYLHNAIKCLPGEGHGNPLQYSCLETPHGQRSLADYRPWGQREPDTTEAT